MEQSSDCIYREELGMPGFVMWSLLVSMIMTPLIVIFAYSVQPPDAAIRRLITHSPSGSAIALIILAASVVPNLWWLFAIKARAAVLTVMADGVHLSRTFTGAKARVIPFSLISGCRIPESKPTYSELNHMMRKGGFWGLGNTSLVELETTDGEKLLVGTRRPDELASAIQARLV
jgi:hypothetical protein